MNSKNIEKFQLTTSIANKNQVILICLLRDGRLVSLGRGRIVIYKTYTFQPHIVIQECDIINSASVLRNENLLFSCGKYILIYKIGQNNYKLIHTLKGHTDLVNEVIEMEDGRLCSCSEDKTVIIWNNNYQPVQILNNRRISTAFILEVNDHLLFFHNQSMKIWNKHTYESIYITESSIHCCGRNGTSKLKDNTIVLGKYNRLVILNIISLQYKLFQDYRLGEIRSILALTEAQILIGNSAGQIITYDSLSNQITFTQQAHRSSVLCMIKNEDNQIFSSSLDHTVNFYLNV